MYQPAWPLVSSGPFLFSKEPIPTAAGTIGWPLETTGGTGGSTLKLGILAGDGHLPMAFAQKAKKNGHTVVAIRVVTGGPDLSPYVDKLYEIPVGQWGRIIETLQWEGIDEVYLLGKVQKGLMYTQMESDLRFQQVLSRLTVRNDDAVVLAFIDDLAREGIRVGSQVELISELLAREGILTSTSLTEAQWADVRFGYRMAKGIAGLDIGQTVVVKDTAVVAVEAIEGTDRTILRAGELAGPGTVVVKVAKPKQDLRFDVPTIGVGTLDSMKKAGAAVLAVEAGATLIVDEEAVVRSAEELGISVVAVR